MKTNFVKNIYSIFCVFILFFGCSQEGEVGPRGLDGLSGTIIYSGNTIPSASTGDIGDYYFDTASSDFYGPKTAAGWGNPVNLTGAKGATGERGATGATGPAGPTGSAGANGNKIIAFSRGPLSEDGVVGDFYIDLLTSNLYGPKTANGWGTAVNLKGANGEHGTKIHNGSGVPSSTLGVNGDFYFQSNGNWYGPKSVNGWGVPISLVGATGAKGDAGSPGSNGQNGKTILNGTTVPADNNGAIGDFYYRTNTGDFYGPKTASGWGTPLNLKGQVGNKIWSGNTEPDSELGNVGDYYINTSTGDFYGPKSTDTWGNPVSLRGLDGVNGTRILKGGYDPRDTTGNAGDYFINFFTGDLFGPKSASNGWGQPVINMRGGEPTEVIFSDWIVISPTSSDVISSSANEIIIQRQLYVLSKNNTFINNASINVYAKVLQPNSTSIVQLNNNFDFGLGYPASMDYRIVEESTPTTTSYKLLIRIVGSRLNNNLFNSLSFRYVVIPGNKSANIYISKSTDSYNQLKYLFNIKD